MPERRFRVPIPLRWPRALLALTAFAGLALGVSRIPEALARVPWFDVRDRVVEGVRLLDPQVAVAQAAVPDGASVWDDPAAWEARLRAHPLVEDVRIRRRLPATLVFEVVEVEPAAYVPRGTLQPVDRNGRALPVDPTVHRLDLPVVDPNRGGVPGDTLGLDEVRLVVTELDRLRTLAPRVASAVSEAGLLEDGSLDLRLVRPRLRVLAVPPVRSGVLDRLLEVLEDLERRSLTRMPWTVDLRFDDQAVVREFK